MKKVSARQFIIFYVMYTFASKFLMLPHFLAGDAGRDAWIGAVLGSLIELGLLFVVLRVLAFNRNEDTYETLRRPLKPVGAKIVLGVLTLFFIRKCTDQQIFLYRKTREHLPSFR